MSVVLIIVAALLCGLLVLLSYVERIYAEMGKFLARDFQENIESYEQLVEPRLGGNRNRISLAVSVLTQFTTAAIAFIAGYYIFRDGWTASEILQGAILLVLLITVFNRLLPYVLFTRTKGDWLAPFTMLLRVLMFAAMPVTIILGFSMSVAALAEEREPQEPEHHSEAVDALIEKGQEEGILEESDRQLIQSVVEFGDKVVGEVMTPRPAVVAVSENTTVEQLTELLRTKPYSRVPVYGTDIDDIKGIVFAHDILQVSDTEARTQTVARMVRPVHFVPETKHVSELLRELQREAAQMAIVIDEYGGVAGVVTVEDLVEEIVGEIRDEHEAVADIQQENENTYIVPGHIDVDRLQELFGVRPENVEATTVAGLVSELIGRIPEAGEVVEQEGLRFEILESTDRRIERLRISPLEQSEERQVSA